MTKIAIISQAEQGVLIDISGCSSLTEAKQYLTSTLQVSSQFWEGLIVDLNLGPLVLTPEQVAEIQDIVLNVGVQPRQIFSHSPITRASLVQCRLPLGVSQQLQSYAGVQLNESAAQSEVLTKTSMASELQAAINGAETVTASGTTATATKDMNWSDDSYAGVGLTPPDKANAGPSESFHQSATARLEVSNFNPADQIIPSISIACEAPTENVAETEIAPVPIAKKAPVVKPALSPVKPQNPVVLMMKQTLRSGQRVSHKGHLVIIGDVNPGAELVADGDITIWGALRGMAHAGASGNSSAEIRALKFEPIQLRIAQAIARSPDRNKPGSTHSSGPETARIIEGKIRISGSEPD